MGGRKKDRRPEKGKSFSNNETVQNLSAPQQIYNYKYIHGGKNISIRIKSKQRRRTTQCDSQHASKRVGERSGVGGRIAVGKKGKKTEVKTQEERLPRNEKQTNQQT